MKTVLVILSCLALTACGTFSNEKVDGDYKAYLEANKERIATQKQEIQLVKITAQPGQTISFTGVQEFSVFMPAPAQAPIQQRSVPPSEFVQIMDRLMPVVGTVGAIWAGGKAAEGLANSVGKYSSAGYPYVQAPGASTTTNNLSGTGVIGSGTNTNTTTTTSTLSGSGVLGSGTYNGPTTTDSHNTTDNHTTNPPVMVPGARICTVDPATNALTCL